MNETDTLRGFFALIFALAITVGMFLRQNDTEQGETQELRKIWAPVVSPTLLPVNFLVLPILALVIGGGRTYLARELLELLFGVFLHIGLYDILLLALLPLLRRFIRARTVAILWLIPNFLYVTAYSYMRPSAPKLVLHVSRAVLRYGAILWAVGFALVLIFGIGQHLVFRKKILRNAEPVTDPTLLKYWEDLQTKDAGLKKAKLKLVCSDQAGTPLSVGLFQRTMRVVLPDKEYTQAELELILRHELAHILRCDSQTKFFLRFCTAMCWFNPFMWIAMKKCAEDLELSCDEMVLENADAACREQYANLILSTAGDARGFTTCLSADAKALRYRLRNIINPQKRLMGALLAGVLFFTLVISSGWVALAYEVKSVGQEYPQYDFSVLAEDMTLVTVIEDGSYRSYDCTDAQALMDYVRSLPTWKLTGSYAAEQSDGRKLSVLFHAPDGFLSMSLSDTEIVIMDPMTKEATRTQRFYLQQPPNWDYVMSLLEPYEETVYTLPCEMGLNFGSAITPEGKFFDIAPRILSHTVDGAPQVLPEPPAWAGFELEGFDVQDVQLVFYAQTPDSIEITVEGLNGEAPYMQQTEEDYMLPLADYSAVYSVRCSFSQNVNGQEEIYEIEYVFEVILPE